MFKALLITQNDGQYRAALTDIDEAQLPEGDVLVQVTHSTLNYKDALAITGLSPVVRRFPMVAGIDLAGTVLESASDAFQPGDAVLLNGWGIGETHWGGLAEKARVKSEWLLPLPHNISAAQAMAVGTAGYTAALAVLAVQDHGITPAHGPVLVTGANGGVGSFATALLAKLGYHVIASTGRPSEQDYLRTLGARDIIDRAELGVPGKPLMKERWAAAVDSVGSHTLANVCASTYTHGVVAACGLAQGMDFPATVAPFILRGIALQGIDSVTCPMPQRRRAWQLLAEHTDPALLARISSAEIPLADALEYAGKLLKGEIRGRVVVKI
ncbi:acrylyl-CoA reductase (NADPH) [Neisseria sp. HSC-16F19]|nr:MDR family oxidoreductase [Neisseria sp. HSC-16F19]MCP2040774.1 acrylyl-CoA reductase (NADPH) [Neisseria sp. HSC-16F19]